MNEERRTNIVVDESLNEFDSLGTQTVFAIPPFGNSETRKERIERLERMGMLDPDCKTCQEYFYTHHSLEPFYPRHKPGSMCQSGKKPHCTCPTCWG